MCVCVTSQCSSNWISCIAANKSMVVPYYLIGVHHGVKQLNEWMIERAHGMNEWEWVSECIHTTLNKRVFRSQSKLKKKTTMAMVIAAENNFNDCIGLLNYYESIAFCFVSLRSHTHNWNSFQINSNTPYFYALFSSSQNYCEAAERSIWYIWLITISFGRTLVRAWQCYVNSCVFHI